MDEKYLYIKKSAHKNIHRYECYHSSCKSRVILDTNDNTVIRHSKWVDHIHPNDEQKYHTFQLAHTIKTKCAESAESGTSIRQIYINECIK